MNFCKTVALFLILFFISMSPSNLFADNHDVDPNIVDQAKEITEELDITIDVGKKFGQVKHQYTHFTINLVGYHCHYKQGTPKPLSSTELRWIKFNQITDLAFPKSTLKLFNLYEKDFR